MSSFSPEQALSETLHRELAFALSTLYPWEYQADCHVPMSGDPDIDRSLLDAIYSFPDAGVLDDTFEDLVEFFDESFEAATPFLCEKWDIDNTEVLPWPEEETQLAARYSSVENGEVYEITVAHWKQPTPYAGMPADMICVSIEADSLSSPTMRIVFYNQEPLLSCRYVTTAVSDLPNVGWENFGELSPEQLLLMQKLIGNIPLREFDITP